MLTLAIDCATEACSVALFDADRLLAGDSRMLGRGHAEQLIPMIAALPGKGRAERICVSRGPGSFTGVRIGIAAARALGLAWNAPVLGYPALALVAAMARTERGARPVAAAMNGGHGEWFVAAFDEFGAETRPVASLSPDEARHLPEALVAGTRAEDLVAARGSGEALAIWPDARCFMALDPAQLGEPAPLYGRPPDARLPA